MTISYVAAPMGAIQWAPNDIEMCNIPNGALFTFKNNAPSTKKYTYQDPGGIVKNPNPIRLDVAGRINTPIYWETGGTESYYVSLTDADMDLDNPISTIKNFPPPSGGSSPVTNNLDFTNHIINGQFRYFREESIKLTDTEQYIADGKISFRKSNTSGTDTISYKLFTPGQTDVPANPKYYLQYQATIAGSGETFKDILFDMGDVRTFENRQITFQLEAKSPGSDSMELFWIQEFGVGGSVAVPTSLGAITTTTIWDKYIKTIVSIPSTAGKTIKDGSRALLSIRVPLDAVTTMHIANVAVNIGDVAFDYEYFTAQQERIRTNGVELPQIIEPSEDGGLKKLPHSFVGVSPDLTGIYQRHVGVMSAYPKETAPPWALPCDWTSYFGSDYPDLYSVIGNDYGVGILGFSTYIASDLVRAVNWVPGPVNDAVDVSTGWAFNKVHDGNDYGFESKALVGFQELDSITPPAPSYKQDNDPYLLVTNKVVGVVTTATIGTTTFTLKILQVGTVALPEITRFIPVAASAITGGQYFTVDSASISYYVWFKKDGVGVDPSVGGKTGILVEIVTTDDEAIVARKISDILKGSEITDITTTDGSTATAGDYFTMEAISQAYYIYITLDGVKTDPAIGGKKGIELKLLSADTAAEVAAKLGAVIIGIQFQTPYTSGRTLRGWDDGNGVDPDAVYRMRSIDRPSLGTVLSGDHVGTWQEDVMGDHQHVTALPSNIQTFGSTDMYGVFSSVSASAGVINAQMTDSVGTNETRGKNLGVLWIINI